MSRTCVLFMSLCSRLSKSRLQSCILHTQRGVASQELKKFYKDATITQGEEGFEINLDKRKLKTPLGTLFKVPTEALAIAVATEWNAQQKVIKRHNMHLNLLCNTAIDNPTHRDRDTVIGGILEFLDTDTILYRTNEPAELEELQKREWGSLLQWVTDRYDVHLEVTTGIGVPHIPDATRAVFRQHLESFNDWALVGYQNAVETIRSIVITLGVVDRHISVEKAVQLSRLEQEFQITKWGNIEWYHDIDQMEQRTRLAAAILFVHLNSADNVTMFNKMNAGRPV